MNIEWELINDVRSGRWRRRQYYSTIRDKRPPSQRKECEWRSGVPAVLASDLKIIRSFNCQDY